MSLNIYNPTTQQLTEVAGLDVKDSLEKVATLPTPTADYLNQVYILVGTQEGYHVGSIYQCRYINSAYTWVEITGSVVDKADKAPNATNNHLAKLTADGNLADSGIAVGDLGTAINKNWTDLVRPNSHDLVESNAVYSAITNAISSIYTPHGDITCAELVPALLIDENIGNVYTVTDSGTTTAYFMQGAGKTINTGDSVSIIKAGQNTILFNLMGNVLDLTDYQKKNLTTPLTIGGTTQTTVEGALGGLNTKEIDDIEGIYKANSVFGVKNLIPFPPYTRTLGNPILYGGVTYTQNADESVTLNGTPTNSSVYHLLHRSYEESHIFEDLGAGDYILTCDVSDEDVAFACYLGYLDGEGNTTWINPPHVDSKGSIAYTFTVTEAMSHYGWSLQIGALTAQSTSYDNFTVRTMIRLASDPDDTYRPYAMTNRELTVTSYTDNSVYISRTSKGDLVDMSLIGGTVAWNQLAGPLTSGTTLSGITYTKVNDHTFTISGTATARASYPIVTAIPVVKDHVYLLKGMEQNTQSIALLFNGYNNRTYVVTYPQRDTGNGILVKNTNESVNEANLECVVNSGTALSKTYTVVPQFHDLTQMFGTTIADYVYNLEQSVGGSGIAWLQSYGFFTKDYYAYDAGSLQSVNTKGRKITSGSESTTYAIDPIDLRGVPKLVNNKLNYDGDIYKSNGAITRKYGIVDLGTLNWALHSSTKRIQTSTLSNLIKRPTNNYSGNMPHCIVIGYTQVYGGNVNDSYGQDKIFGLFTDGVVAFYNSLYTDATTFKTAMSGVYLVYELETQTTEIVSPYINPQRVYDGGTEEFLRDSAPIIPVGVEAEYYNNKTSVLATEYTDSVSNSKVDWKSNGIIGAKNLDGTTRKSQTVNGIAYTVNSDGTVTANGTASATSQLDVSHDALSFTASFSAQVILTGGIADGIEIYPWDYTSDTRPYTDATKTTRLSSSSNSRGDNEVSFYMEKGHQYLMCIRIVSGKTVSDAVFKPLLRLATDPDNTYTPYAMTNKELTNGLAELNEYKLRTATRVNVKDYTVSNKYTAPKDGYVMFLGSTASETILNLNSVGLIASTTTSGRNAIFVKKGMTIHFEGNTASYAYYYPFE